MTVDRAFTEMVARLQDTLGGRLVAYIGGATSTRTVAQWVRGTAQPGQDEQERLQRAHEIAIVLAARYDSTMIQSWFMGMNMELADESPAKILASSALKEAAPRVLAAARAFTETGSYS